MPSRIASATSCAWVPSCRSRSIRRSVAADASTVWVRACSNERTRAAIGSGPSRVRCRNLSTVTKQRITQGAAKKKITPRMKMPTPCQNPTGPELRLPPGVMTFGKEPQIADPPLLLQKSGRRMHATASHHRLNATYTPRKVHGTLRAK